MPAPPPEDPFLPQLEGYEAARVPGVRAGKTYICPSCDAPIAAGVGHVVVWPEEQVEERRHWHQHCWRIAVRRRRVT